MMKDEKKGSVSGHMPNLMQECCGQIDLDLREELGHELRKALIKTRLKQRELSTLLAIQQPEVSHLFNGHFNRFTIDKLIRLFNRLGWVVEFQIHPCEPEKT
ncbi:MAG: helix-turn-helix domain-containing protein [Leptolyngbyaceae cyanobacterium]